DQVVIALRGVEFRGEAPHIADRVCGPSGTRDSGETHEHRGLDRWIGEELGDGVLGQRAVIRLEVPVGASPSGVYYPLRDPLVIEVGDLLPGVEILQQGRAPLADRQRIVGVIDSDTLIGGQVSTGGIDSYRVELPLLVSSVVISAVLCRR